MQYDKLVRDRIPEIIERAGKTAVIRVLTQEQFIVALNEKLLEEAAEIADAADRDSLLSELADLAEVLDAVVTAHNFTPADVRSRREVRNDERGRFEARIWLERVD